MRQDERFILLEDEINKNRESGAGLLSLFLSVKLYDRFCVPMCGFCVPMCGFCVPLYRFCGMLRRIVYANGVRR